MPGLESSEEHNKETDWRIVQDGVYASIMRVRVDAEEDSDLTDHDHDVGKDLVHQLDTL